jgi:hypothetical protein
MALLPWLQTFVDSLSEWTDDFDVSERMLLSWIGMAEERFNNELRALEMVKITRVDLADQCVPLPPDFLEMVNLRYTESGLPLRYISSDEFYRVRASSEYYLSGPQTTAITYLDPQTGQPLGPLPRQPAFVDYPGRSGPKLPLARNVYTLLGQTLMVHPTVAEPSADVDPTELELAYYGMVPPLVEATEPTPLFKRAPKLYTYATLAQSAPYLVEDQRTQVWDSNATALITKMNEAARTGVIASSPIVMQVRSFG